MTIWTNAHVEVLRALFTQGLTHAQIATEMQDTESAISSACRRHGLMRGARSSRFLAGIRTITNPGAYTEPMKVNGRPVTMMDLTAKMCRWPFGDPTSPDFHFCGHPKHAEFPYCAHHVAIAYRGANTPEAEAA